MKGLKPLPIKIFKYLNQLSWVLKLNFIGLFLAFILYFLFWKTTQGKDLLIIISQHYSTTLAFYLGLSFLAFMAWFCPKILHPANAKSIKLSELVKKGFSLTEHLALKNHQVNVKENRNELVTKAHLAKTMPRLIAFAIFLIPAFSIRQLHLTLYKTGSDAVNSNHILLAIITLLIALNLRSIYKFIAVKMQALKPYAIAISIIISCAIIALLLLVQTNSIVQYNPIAKMYYTLLLLGTSFFLLLNFRVKFVKLRSESFWLKGFFAIGTSISLFYLLLVFYPVLTAKVNPVIVGFVALIAISFVAILCRIKELQSKGAQLLLFAIVLITFSISFPHKKHFHVDLPASTNQVIRPNVNEYISTWISDEEKLSRLAQFKKEEKPYPIYIVLSEGGGSRAGLWTMLVNNYLQHQNDSSDFFNHHVISFSGASGGMVGNGLFFNLMQSNLTGAEKEEFIHSFYEQNYLSNSIVGLMGGDFIKGFGKGIFNDRSDILKNQWNRQFSNVSFTDKNLFDAAFYEIWNAKSNVQPLLLVNTTNVSNGKQTLISPVSFQNHTQDDLFQHSHVQSIKLSDALMLNARFPWINSAGYINGIGQFMDAGVTDNYGVTTAELMYTALAKFLDEHKLTEQFDVKFIAIKNGQTSLLDINNGYSSQLTSPFSAVINSRKAQSNSGYNLLLQKFKEKVHTVNLTNTEVTVASGKLGVHKIQPIIPMNRFLSDISREGINNCLTQNEQVQHSLNQIIGEMSLAADYQLAKPPLTYLK